MATDEEARVEQHIDIEGSDSISTGSDPESLNGSHAGSKAVRLVASVVGAAALVCVVVLLSTTRGSSKDEGRAPSGSEFVGLSEEEDLQTRKPYFVDSYGKYPGYDGNGYATGVTSVTYAGKGKISLAWSLKVISSGCKKGPKKDVPNSCGIHIHVGTTCSDANTVGGHYYSPDLDEDPWKVVSYTLISGTSITTDDVEVDTGLAFKKLGGHVMIVHDSKGVRLACGQIGFTTDSYYAQQFRPYPDYGGDLKVFGAISVAYDKKGTQSLYWELQDVDPACATGPKSDVPNSCGIHIHVGKNCNDKDTIGGHYYSDELSEDPWQVVSYTTVVAGETSYAWDQDVEVVTGLLFPATLGHTMIVHDATGARISCAPLKYQPSPYFVESFRVYPGYTGDLEVSGYMQVSMSNAGVQSLVWELANVDPDCKDGAGDAPNSCGVHIHLGTNCNDANTVGGHYWNTLEFQDDPWAEVSYSAVQSDKQGSDGAQIAFSKRDVVTGLRFAQTEGHAMVVHDFTGARVACGIIGTQSDSFYVGSLEPYPDYSGSLKVAGGLSVSYTSPGTQALAWQLTGVDPACKDGPGDAPNSCGIHIHVGTADSSANCAYKDTIGGHFYNKEYYPDSDPWQAVSYYSPAEDGVNYAFSSNVYVSTGYLYVDMYSHTMIVHDYTGARIACGIVGESPPAYVVANFSKYPGYTGSLAVDGSMNVSFLTSGTQGLTWQLSGTDPNCKKGAKDGVANSCGIHIHVGTDCSDASTVGGHYWNKVEFTDYDPWQSVGYKSYGSNNKGKASGETSVTTGLTWTDIKGHVMIVHDADGGRVACGTINTPAVDCRQPGEPCDLNHPCCESYSECYDYGQETKTCSYE